MAMSQVRKDATEVLSLVGVKPKHKVYVDKSKSGHRAKFCWVKPTDEQMVVLRTEFAKKYPNTSTRVWIVEHNAGSHSMYGGVAFKVFNS